MSSASIVGRFSIGELIERGAIQLHKDGNHGSNYPRANEFGEDGIPFLTAKLIDDATGRIDFPNAPRLNAKKAKKLNFGWIEENDVLLSHNATVGRVAIVPPLHEPVLIGTSLTCFRLDQTKILPRYLAAFFQGVDFQNQLAAVMSQTTRNQVPITSQRKLEIEVPEIHTQCRIASILGSLDDKIELNRRMNADECDVGVDGTSDLQELVHRRRSRPPQRGTIRLPPPTHQLRPPIPRFI